MTRKEAVRITTQENVLLDLGFTRSEAESLRRISMTLQRWYELECGDSRDNASWAIERDDNGDGPPFMVDHYYPQGRPTVTTRTRIADRENGAKRRLAAIVDRRNARITDLTSKDVELNIHASCHARSTGPVAYYLQSDPRGAVLYILRLGDVPDGKTADAYYNRGICVY